MPKPVNCLELKVPPPVLALTFVAVMWFTSVQLFSLAFASPWTQLLASGLAGTGFILALAGVIAFRRAKTTVNPTNPSATSVLVTSGPNRLSRNPMYLGVLLLLTGWATFLSNILAFLFLPVFVVYMNRFQIAPEERVLSEKFGEAFATYKRSVRRWL